MNVVELDCVENSVGKLPISSVSSGEFDLNVGLVSAERTNTSDGFFKLAVESDDDDGGLDVVVPCPTEGSEKSTLLSA